MKKRMLLINATDNVGVLLEDVNQGDFVGFEGLELIANEKIEFAHKIAVRNINIGEEITKYGEAIGYALRPINKGEWIHTHNLDCKRGRMGRS